MLNLCFEALLPRKKADSAAIYTKKQEKTANGVPLQKNKMLNHKTIVITGASKGIGAALAQVLSSTFNVNLALISSNIKNLEWLRALPNAYILEADVRSETQINDAISKILARFGSIDVLVNNAGLGTFGDIEATDLAVYEQMFDVNVKGSFICAKAVIPLLKAQKSGHILQVCSDVSRRTFAGGSGYCATKYAQEALGNAMRKELRSHGIKVSNVYPGKTDTFFGGTAQGADHKTDWLRAKDVADAIVYVLNTPPNVLIDELQIHPLEQEF